MSGRTTTELRYAPLGSKGNALFNALNTIYGYIERRGDGGGGEGTACTVGTREYKQSDRCR